MRVLDVVNFLKGNGVAPGYASDLTVLNSVYTRIMALVWDQLRGSFFFQVEAAVTPTETYTGVAGATIITASGAFSENADVYLGREFLNDDGPIKVVGVDTTLNVLHLNQPLQTAIAAGTAVEFFRRTYVPTNDQGLRLGKVRSDPTYARPGRLALRTPVRMPPIAGSLHGSASLLGTSLFTYMPCEHVRPPLLAPVVTQNPAGGSSVDQGNYRAYMVNKIGPFYSPLSPASNTLNFAGAVPGTQQGVITTQNLGFEEKVFLVEGPLQDVDGIDGKQSRTGLRVVSETSALVANFEFDEAWIMRLPIFSPTNGSLSISYGGQPDERRNVSVTGYPHFQKIHSYYDHLVLDERFLIAWREYTKNMETGDGKHFMAARAAIMAISGGSIL